MTQDIIQQLKKVAGVFETYQLVASYKLHRSSKNGKSQIVRVEVFDAGEGADPAQRYHCYALADDGTYAAGNPDNSITNALDRVHWEHLDWSPEAPTPLPSLSDDAKELLLAAVQSSGKRIVALRTVGGISIKVDGREFVEKGDPQSAAIWDGALEELRDANFLKAVDPAGKVCTVTVQGYQAAGALGQV